MYNCKYFGISELRQVCSDGLLENINDDSLQRLDRARQLAGVPFRLSSAYRNELDNRRVGGVPNSAHLRGRAFDILCADTKSRNRILFGVIAAGFRRIGIARTYIHVDDDPSLPQDVTWIY